MSVDGVLVMNISFALTSFSTIIVGLRFFCRYYYRHSIRLFDYFMLAALVATWGNTVINYYQVQFGNGARVSLLRKFGPTPSFQRALSGTLITWYLYRITYPIALCLVKLSILLFYRSLAHPAHKLFRHAVTATLTFLSLYTLATCLASFLQCAPNISDAFSPAPSMFSSTRGRVGRPPVKCFDPTPLWAFSGAANLLTDIIILILPLPLLLNLSIPLSKRLALVGLFSIGIVAVGASCVRLWIMAKWARDVTSQGRYGMELLFWGQVECNGAVVCANMPFLKSLVDPPPGKADVDEGVWNGGEKGRRRPLEEVSLEEGNTEITLSPVEMGSKEMQI